MTSGRTVGENYMVKFGVSLPTIGMGDPRAIRLVAQQVEAAGLDSVWAADHIVLPTGDTSPYPYAEGGEFLIPPGMPFMDQFTSLAYVAGITERIMLGTAVTLLPLRHPLSVAKTVATLDVLSGGRAILGVAAGWLEEEFRALGIDFKARGKMLDEGLDVLREIWTQPNASHHGEFYDFHDVAAYPQPSQKPHPPIWVGGHTQPVMRRAARVGDMWLPPLFQTTPHDLAERYAQVQTMAEGHGRHSDDVGLALRVLVDLREEPDPSGPQKRGALLGPPERVIETLASYQEIGVSHFVLLPQARSLDDVQRTIDVIAKDVVPALRKDQQ
jgi:probable F420-dependent oxidoreductase